MKLWVTLYDEVKLDILVKLRNEWLYMMNISSSATIVNLHVVDPAKYLFWSFLQK